MRGYPPDALAGVRLMARAGERALFARVSPWSVHTGWFDERLQGAARTWLDGLAVRHYPEMLALDALGRAPRPR